MTNHWTDIGNASLVFVMGANPAENHPACFAHINAARANGAKLIVVDPRRTRTALQADNYVRIRPGTDIAFINGMMNFIFAEADKAQAAGGSYNDTYLKRMLDWHNGAQYYGDKAPNSTVGRSYMNDAGSAATITVSKYTDSRFKVAANGDYQRATNNGCSNFPVEAAFDGTSAATAAASGVNATDTVWQKLKAHVGAYDLDTVATICECSVEEIKLCARAFIDNSRFASTDFGVSPSTPQVGPAGGYRATTWLYAMGGTQHSYGSQNCRQYTVVQSLMGNVGRAGGGINALRGIHNVQGSTDMGLLFDTYPAYGTIGKSTQTWATYMNLQFGYRTVGTGAKDATDYGVLGMQQRGFYAMTRQFFAGARVASSASATDESVVLTGTASTALAHGAIVPSSFVVKDSSGLVTYELNKDYQVAYATGAQGTTAGKLQRVAGGAIADGATVKVSYTYVTPMAGSDVAALWALWPKNNGYDHITAFRKMAASTPAAEKIRACYVIGQNPAVTEPNQSAVRTGLENLDLLVVHEMFPTETVQCKRKTGSVTYLIPSCSHVEEAGSVTNSGRWLQWRQQARQPKDNSKADLELVLRLAKALDVAGTFSHIPLDAAFANRYEQLYAYYGWTPGQAFDSEKIAENVFKEFAAPQAEAYAGTDASKYTINAGDPLLRGATMWIYYNAYCKNLTEAGFGGADTDAWGDANRAKSRVTVANTAKTFSKWGWAWLKNRRVFYNNGEVPQDVSDNFVGPDYVARLYINRNVSVVDYAAGAGLAYRNYKVMKDVSSIDTTHPNGVNGTNTYGQFPAHSEPVETSKTTLAGTWGYNNYIDTASYDANTWVQANGALFHECVMSDTLKGDVGTYPLTMISVRCVEHFQGGPITRNNEWNVQLEPEPWIEINPLDARKYGISDGDLVNVVTARSNSAGPTALNPTRVDDQASRTSVSGFAKGFRARVDSSIAVYQRVAPGVVAIPWHWGDRGLSTGSRANDLCIDAFDANTKIPEYKACLCRIEKA